MTFSSKIHHIKYKKTSPSGQKKLNIQTQTKQKLALQHILPKMYKTVTTSYTVFPVTNLISNGIDYMSSSIATKSADEKISYKNVTSNNTNNKYQ